MSTFSGTDATVKLGTDLIAEMASWTLERTREGLRAPVFGDVNSKVHGVASKIWNGTIEGFLDISDSTGQDVIEAAYENGTKLTNLRLYIDDTSYYAPDTDTDANAGVYITSFSTGAAQDEIIPISFSYEGTGALKTP